MKRPSHLLLTMTTAAALAVSACQSPTAQPLPGGREPQVDTPAPTTGAGTGATGSGLAVIGPSIPADAPPFLVATFDKFPAEFLPDVVLDLDGGVVVTLDGAGASPIFPPGFGFATNYLSTGVQRGRNEVHVTPPAGARSLGLFLVSVHPITLTAVDGDGLSDTITFSAEAPTFVGFSSAAGIERITVSSEPDPRLTPIVNIAEIRYSFS